MLALQGFNIYDIQKFKPNAIMPFAVISKMSIHLSENII